jgi:S1-C subfamily serine protease
MKKGEHILVPFLGVEFNVTRLGRGAQVMRVVAVTAAQEAGVKSGDIILAIDEATIDSPFQLQHIIGSHDVGDTVTLTIDRGGKNVTLKAKLRAMRLDQMR